MKLSDMPVKQLITFVDDLNSGKQTLNYDAETGCIDILLSKYKINNEVSPPEVIQLPSEAVGMGREYFREVRAFIEAELTETEKTLTDIKVRRAIAIQGQDAINTLEKQYQEMLEANIVLPDALQ